MGEAPLQIIDGDRGKNYPGQTEFAPEGHCLFLNAGNVTALGFDFSDCAFISEERDNLLRKGKLQRNDIVLTTRGTVGNVAYFDSSVPYEHIRINSGMVIVRTSTQELSPRYLYSLLRSDLFQKQVRALVSGSAQPQLPIRDINKIEIPIPPNHDQHRVVSVLGALDDRITMLARHSVVLEQIAHAVFKSWFVDFDPVRAKAEGREPEGMDAAAAALFPSEFQETERGPIPNGWSISTIGQTVNVVDCLHSKKPERTERGKPFLQLSNICGNGIVDMSDTYHISDADYEKWISRIEASPGDCVITNVGRVGAVAQIPAGVNAALGRNMTGLRCKENFRFPTFLIELMMSGAMREEISLKTDSGTILDSLNVRSIPRLRFVRPSDQMLQYFETTCRPLRARMEVGCEQSRTLTEVRDTLLPRLVSGSLRVPEAVKLVEAVV